MKKTLLLFVMLISMGYSSYALTIADQDFTGTDLNGNTYTLYDLLDQGKYVYMYFGYIG